MEDKPNYYAVIPATIRYDKELSSSEKLFYGEISALSKANGVCYASNNYFSKLFDVSPSSISNWVKKLKDKGYIDVEYIYESNSKEIKQRNIKIGIQNIDNLLKKFGEGYSKNLKENNTSIINNNNNNGNLYDYIQNTLGIVLNDIEYRIISTWEDNELTRYAIDKAGLSRKYNIKYIQKILSNYQINNVKTVNEAIEFDENFNNKKQINSYKPKQVHKTISEEFDGGIRIL